MIFTPKQIVVHHDGVSRSGPSFDVINTYHQSEHFPLSSLGYYVGYHFFIEKDGTIKQARREDEIGAHTLGQNYTALGIGMAGNFDKEMPTDAQITSLGTLLSRLCLTHGIAGDQIFPHRKYNPKTCYGTLLSDTWAQGVFLQYEHARITAQCAALGIPTSQPLKKKAGALLAWLVAKLARV